MLAHATRPLFNSKTLSLFPFSLSLSLSLTLKPFSFCRLAPSRLHHVCQSDDSSSSNNNSGRHDSGLACGEYACAQAQTLKHTFFRVRSFYRAIVQSYIMYDCMIVRSSEKNLHLIFIAFIARAARNNQSCCWLMKNALLTSPALEVSLNCLCVCVSYSIKSKQARCDECSI